MAKINSFSRVRPNVFNALAAAAAMYTGTKNGQRMRGRGGYSTTTSRKKQKSGIQYTVQKDSRVQYRKKSMPRRKKRAWKKFVKKSLAASLKLVGTNTHLKNTQRTSGTIGTGQGYISCHLYGLKGTDTGNTTFGEMGWNDIEEVDSADSRITDSHKVLFSSAVLDATLRNSGDVDLEVDIYELSYGDGINVNNLHSLLGAAQNNTPVIPGSLSGINLTSRGATLFDLPQAIKYGKIKIWKKTKVFLPVNETTNYQIRDPRNHLYSMDKLASFTSNGYIQKGLTKTILIVYKNVVGTAIEGISMSVGCTRKYCYKIYEDSGDNDVYV